jgi:hypothetical protein
MATNFPTSVDALTNPVSNDSLNSPSHSAQHANANDAIEAIETYMGLVLVSTTNFTSQTSVNLFGCFTSTYKHYVAEIDFVHSSGSMITYLQYYNGATLLNGATDYQWQETYFTTTTGSTRSTGDAYSQILQNSGATNVVSSIKFYNPQVSGLSTNTNHYLSAGAFTTIGAGSYKPTTAVDGFRFVWSAGTATGTIRLYGYRNL